VARRADRVVHMRDGVIESDQSNHHEHATRLTFDA
jgi:hypothetical protein